MVRVDKAAIFNQIKGGIKREALPKQYQELFDILNTDGNDVLDSTEVTPERLTTIFQDIQKNNPDADIEGFKIQLQNAGQKIRGSRTTVNSDGTKTVETVYDDTLETTVYYPDGEIKMRKRDTLKEQVVVDTLQTGKYEAAHEQKANYYVNSSLDTNVVFSPRAKEELRQFTGNEFAQSVDSYYPMIAYWGDRNGDLSHIGQAINDGVQELIASATGGEYNTYAELYAQAHKNKENAGTLKFAAMTDPNSPYAKANGINFEQTYRDITGQEYNLEKINNFQQTAVKYNTVTALK